MNSLDQIYYLISQSRFQEARDSCLRELRSDPDNGLVHAHLAICHWELGQKKEALSSAQRGAALSPEDPDCLRILGTIQFNLGKAAAAQSTFDRLFSLSPEDPLMHAFRAESAAIKSDWRQALSAADSGLRIDPLDAHCMIQRARAQTNLGRTMEAETTIDRALSHDPENAEAFEAAGLNELRKANPQLALFHFREALRLNPHLKESRQGLLSCLRAKFPGFRWIVQFLLHYGSLRWYVQSVVVFGYSTLRVSTIDLLNQHPSLQPLSLALNLVAALFLMVVIFGSGLLNVLLLFDPLGRLALTRAERTETLVITGLIGTAALLFAISCLPLDVKLRGFAGYALGMGLLLAMVARIDQIVLRRSVYAAVGGLLTLISLT